MIEEATILRAEGPESELESSLNPRQWGFSNDTNRVLIKDAEGTIFYFPNSTEINTSIGQLGDITWKDPVTSYVDLPTSPTPILGECRIVLDENKLYLWSGSLWVSDTSTGLSALIDDPDPTLGANLNTAGKNITGSGNIQISGSVSCINATTLSGESPERNTNIQSSSMRVPATDTVSALNSNNVFVPVHRTKNFMTRRSPGAEIAETHYYSTKAGSVAGDDDDSEYLSVRGDNTLQLSSYASEEPELRTLQINSSGVLSANAITHDVNADEVEVDSTNFSKILSPSDNNVQKALQTIDDNASEISPDMQDIYNNSGTPASIQQIASKPIAFQNLASDDVLAIDGSEVILNQLKDDANNKNIEITPSGEIYSTETVDSRDLVEVNSTVSNQVATVTFKHTDDSELFITLPASIDSSTGILSGGALEYKDTTSFTIREGEGVIVDYSVSPPLSTYFTWDDMDVDIISFPRFISVAIAPNGTGGVDVHQIDDRPLNARELREYVQLGTCTKFPNLEVYTNPMIAKDQSRAILDWSLRVGCIKQGAALLPYSTSLKIEISQGYYSLPTINVDGNNPLTFKTPSERVIPSIGAPDMLFSKRDPLDPTGWSVERIGATIIPAEWDDGSGTIQTAGVNNYTIGRVYLDPITTTIVYTYPQKVYNSLVDAREGLRDDSIEEPPQVIGRVAQPFIRIGAIIIRSQDTDWSGVNEFYNSDKFGSLGVGGGGTPIVTDNKTSLDGSDSASYLLDKLTPGSGVLFNRGSGPVGDQITIESPDTSLQESYDVDNGSIITDNTKPLAIIDQTGRKVFSVADFPGGSQDSSGVTIAKTSDSAEGMLDIKNNMPGSFSSVIRLESSANTSPFLSISEPSDNEALINLGNTSPAFIQSDSGKLGLNKTPGVNDVETTTLGAERIVLPTGTSGSPSLLVGQSTTGIFGPVAGNVGISAGSVEVSRYSGVSGVTHYLDTTLDSIKTGSVENLQIDGTGKIITGYLRDGMLRASILGQYQSQALDLRAQHNYSTVDTKPIYDDDDQYDNSNIDPFIFPFNITLQYFTVLSSRFSVFSGTKDAFPLVRLRVFTMNGTTSTLIQNVEIPVDGSLVGLNNTTDAGGFQASSLATTITIPANTPFGWDFQNVESSSYINAVRNLNTSCIWREQP